jgi:hypothetical protein
VKSKALVLVWCLMAVLASGMLAARPVEAQSGQPIQIRDLGAGFRLVVLRPEDAPDYLRRQQESTLSSDWFDDLLDAMDMAGMPFEQAAPAAAEALKNLAASSRIYAVAIAMYVQINAPQFAGLVMAALPAAVSAAVFFAEAATVIAAAAVVAVALDEFRTLFKAALTGWLINQAETIRQQARSGDLAHLYEFQQQPLWIRRDQSSVDDNPTTTPSNPGDPTVAPNGQRIRYANFTGIVLKGFPGKVANIRNGPGRGYSVIGQRHAGDQLTFVGWTEGEEVTDEWTGTPDRKWFLLRLPHGGLGYIASALVYGNPPGIWMPRNDTGPRPPESTIHYANFSGVVLQGLSGNAHVRSGPGTTYGSLGLLPAGTRIDFFGWAEGEAIPDMWTGLMDNRWFVYNSGGRTAFIASAVVYGNPP